MENIHNKFLNTEGSDLIFQFFNVNNLIAMYVKKLNCMWKTPQCKHSHSEDTGVAVAAPSSINKLIFSNES